MTSLVGIRCKDGVVIGSDSSATFGDGDRGRTIEQSTDKKIEIIGSENKIIVAGTGYVGHHQRYVEALRVANAEKKFNGSSEWQIAQNLSVTGINDFARSVPQNQLANIGYSALVAFKCGSKPCLVELAGTIGFQPELKQVDDMWFTSSGSGQNLTDPFLALLRSVFWKDGAPDVKGGVFTAFWALHHACTLNPGGINFPIRLAVLGPRSGRVDAWMLSDHDLQETQDMVSAATKHFGEFRTTLLGEKGAEAIPSV